MAVRYNAGKLRAAAYERSGGRCEVTGWALPESWALHHRRERGMGGTSLSSTHTLANVMTVSHQIHNLATRSIHLDPAWAKPRGYMLESWQHPELEPVWIFGSAWCRLSLAGVYLPVETGAPPPAPPDGG